jgi:serine phosphatase RsbU (regulator of sigma subunit)
LYFGLYLGRRDVQRELLDASTNRLPLVGETASTFVKVADSGFLFIGSSINQLGGVLYAEVWWLIALLGLAVTMSGAIVTERLARRRRDAEEFGCEIARLYARQRGVSDSLHKALLPETMSDIGGMKFRVRCVPGVEGLDIGGNWYGVVQMGEDLVLCVVGDVSGRGVRAAGIMAPLRFSMRAYAQQDVPPEMILVTPAKVVVVRREKHFDTAPCLLMDNMCHTLAIVIAGHPPAVVPTGESADFESTVVGPPIGSAIGVEHVPKTVAFGPVSLLLGFTEGMIDRRGKDIDSGLERLRKFVGTADVLSPFDVTVGEIGDELVPGEPSDDIALLAVSWQK